MFICTECKADCTEADRSPWPTLDRCARCMMRRFAVQQALEARLSVETEYGWATAQCVDGTPYRWLCLHLHDSRQEADRCLDEVIPH